jgi:hypothetical protein
MWKLQVALMRRAQALSKSTPWMAGRISIIGGGVPMRKNVPCAMKSSSVIQQRAKFGQGSVERPCVLPIGSDQQSHVFGRARLRVVRHGVSANQKVPNSPVVEDGQEFFEV